MTDDMVTVHYFKAWNANWPGGWERPASKRTVENIAQIKGEAIEGTAELVPRSALDDEGRYFPPEPRVMPD